MLDNRNQHLYQGFKERIDTQEARDAFHMLVDAAKASTKFRCYPKKGPVISELQFHSRDHYSETEQQPFALIIALKWLLFYLGKPTATSKEWSLKKLQQVFSAHSDFPFDSRDHYSETEQQPFAFIINKKWLLFYLREPAVTSNKWSLKKLQQDFPEIKENRKGEWTIRIRDTDVAKQVIEKIVNKY